MKTLDQFLEHHGIKGMKWGVRRKRGPSGRVSSDYSSVSKLKKKKLSELSNDELKKIKKRFDLEKDVSTAKKSPGERFATRVIGQYGNQVIGGLTGAAAGATVAFLLRKG